MTILKCKMYGGDLNFEKDAAVVECEYCRTKQTVPTTGKKIPTCHRSSFESVMEDNNFEQVLENADPIAHSVYRKETKQIEELRHGIIKVSNKEELYDIFICYKETAEKCEKKMLFLCYKNIDAYDMPKEQGVQ